MVCLIGVTSQVYETGTDEFSSIKRKWWKKMTKTEEKENNLKDKTKIEM
jgi:hypothetical protein